MLSPAPIRITVPYTDPKADAATCDFRDISIFLPSSWLSAFASAPELQYDFAAVFGTDRLQEFWSSVDMKHPKFHSLAGRKHARSKCIPLCLHGDGAAFHERDSLMVVSFGGLLREGSTLDSNFVLAAYPKTCSVKGDNGTWDTIWKWIRWDLNALFENRYPSRDPFGEDLDVDSVLGKRAGERILPDNMFCWVFGVQGFWCAE
jgi:hypothetical protein